MSCPMFPREMVLQLKEGQWVLGSGQVGRGVFSNSDEV